MIRFVISEGASCDVEGFHEALLKTAENMLVKGADINFVKDVTGLSNEELAKINTKH